MKINSNLPTIHTLYLIMLQRNFQPWTLYSVVEYHKIPYATFHKISKLCRSKTSLVRNWRANIHNMNSSYYLLLLQLLFITFAIDGQLNF